MDYYRMEDIFVQNIFKLKKAETMFGCRLSEDNHIIRVRAESGEWEGEFIDKIVFINGQIYIAMLGRKSDLFIPEKCLDSSMCKEQESNYNNFIGTMAEIFLMVTGQY